MPWCGPFVRYTACVPKYAPLPPSRDHPNGRWYNNTILHKDQWVHDFYDQVSSTLYKLGLVRAIVYIQLAAAQAAS
jgi:hypothetical protein